MVPGDIYIGKATLVQYEVSYGDAEFGIDPSFEHNECGREVELDTELYGTITPWDYLNAILQHEKECPKKCKTVASPAEDSSMTNAEMQAIKDAAVATGNFKVRDNNSPSKANGNVYASTQEVVEFVERVQTVKPNPNVL